MLTQGNHNIDRRENFKYRCCFVLETCSNAFEITKWHFIALFWSDMLGNFEVNALIFGENGQGLVDIGRLFSSPLPQRTLVKIFYTANNLVAVLGFPK
jgi:hypothetical protein